MKKYTVKEVREITGLGYKQLYEYDTIKPIENLNAAGYKIYDEAGVDKLCQAAMFKALGATPKTINSIFGEKPYDRMKLLDDIIANAKKKVEELNNIIIVAEQLKFLGVEGWGINLLNPKNLNADFKELVKVFADKIRSKKNSDNYRITLQAAMEMTSEAEKEFVRLLKGFANLKDQYPEADLILQHLETFENFLQTHLHLKVPQQMFSLAIGLDGTGEIAASIDALAEKGTAKYISDILSAKYLTHLDNTVNNFLENLEFEVDQSPDDEAVQESIGQLKNIYQTYFRIWMISAT